MKKLIALAVIIFFAATSLCFALTVTGKSGTKLRMVPNGKELEMLQKGANLTFMGKQDKRWIQVKTEAGKEGWVWASNTDFHKTMKKSAMKSKAMPKASQMKKEMKSEPVMEKKSEPSEMEESMPSNESEQSDEESEDTEY